MNCQFPLGVIHGRFQVLHNDHCKYLLAGKELCRHLVIGITNPDPTLSRNEQADPHRSLPLANPLTYYERYRLVRTVMVDAGVAEAEFSIVPLPINLPELFAHYVPMDAVFLLSIYDDWGRRKLARLQELKLATHVMWEVQPQDKGISAEDIRRRMIDGRPWQHLVPGTAARLLQEWAIPQRLRALAGTTGATT